MTTRSSAATRKTLTRNPCWMTRWRPAAPGKPAGPKTQLLGYAPLFALSEVSLINFFAATELEAEVHFFAQEV